MNFLKLNVVNALPAVTSADAGARVLYKNKEWVVLPNGEWWPSVGYKEWSGSVSFDSVVNINYINSSDFDLSFERDSQGIYNTTQDSFLANTEISTNPLDGSSADEGGFSSKLVAILVGGKIRVITSNADNGLEDGIFMNQRFIVRIYPPQPA
jgi:hypothetical protein